MPTERKDLAPAVERWVSANKETVRKQFGDCLLLEYKVLRGRSLPIKGVRPSQRKLMPKAEGAGLLISLPDVGDGFRIPAPCDAVFTANAKSFLVIWPYVPNQRKQDRAVHFVRIGDWLEMERRAEVEGRKSVPLAWIVDKSKTTNVWV